MPSDNSTKATTKAERREAARAEALALRAAQERRDKRNRTFTLGALVLGIAALFGIIAFVFIDSSSEPSASSDDSFVPGTPKPISDVVVPATVNDTGGISVGKDGAAGTVNEGAPRVDIFLDYMCPGCGQLETLNAQELDTLRTSGQATIVYHPLAILDRLSAGTNYSSRAASASAYVAVEASDKFVAFNMGMFENQPEENSTGLTNAEIQKIAEDAGVPAAVAAKIGDGTAVKTFSEWVTAQTAVTVNEPELQTERGFSTPAVTIDGSKWDGNWTQSGAFTAVVAEAAGKE